MFVDDVQQNDGKGVCSFDAECNRIENGVFFTANAPTPPLRIRDRRFVALDPEHGLVFSDVFSDHRGPRRFEVNGTAHGRPCGPCVAHFAWPSY